MQLTYDREHDRLVGGDEVRTFEGQPTKTLLMPMTRALSLNNALKALCEAYPRVSQECTPFPKVLALIDPGVTLADAGLPEAYDELCQMVTIIPQGPTLTRRLPQSDDEGRCFAEKLFSVLRSGHDGALTFGTGGALTSIKAENVTSAGAFVDLYYLRSAAGSCNEAAAHGSAEDIANALSLLWMTCGRTPDQWRLSLHAALGAYRTVTVADQVELVAEATYNSLSVAGSAQTNSIFAVLASGILDGPLSGR